MHGSAFDNTRDSARARARTAVPLRLLYLRAHESQEPLVRERLIRIRYSRSTCYYNQRTKRDSRFTAHWCSDAPRTASLRAALPLSATPHTENIPAASVCAPKPSLRRDGRVAVPRAQPNKQPSTHPTLRSAHTQHSAHIVHGTSPPPPLCSRNLPGAKPESPSDQRSLLWRGGGAANHGSVTTAARAHHVRSLSARVYMPWSSPSAQPMACAQATLSA